MLDHEQKARIEVVGSLLRRRNGASLKEICETTCWQKHFARAALSTLLMTCALVEDRRAETIGASATCHVVEEVETVS